jgi:hypothetical protein
MMRLGTGGIALVICTLLSPAKAQPVSVTATPIAGFAVLGTAAMPPSLSFRGGLELSSDAAEFGGFSGLALSEDCTELVAVSDAGQWLTAAVNYDGGRPAGISDADMGGMRDDKGRQLRGKVRSDAEALSVLGKGVFAVAFESRVRVGTYDLGKSGKAAAFVPVYFPKEISNGPENAEIEALGVLADGRFLAISEGNLDDAGNLRAWLWKRRRVIPFSIARHEDYAVTDLAVLPGGDILTLERSFSASSLPGMALRRFRAGEIAAGKVVRPELLFAGTLPFYQIDNMEGLAVCQRDGETRIAVISDDNFNRRLQRTLLLQFSYAP